MIAAAIVAIVVLGALLAWSLWLGHVRVLDRDRDLVAEVRALREWHE